MEKEILIEKYFRNELSESELVEFKSLYKENDQFKKDVDIQDTLIKGITLNHLEDKMSMLKEIERKEDSISSRSRIISLFSSRLTVIAASIVILIGIAIWMIPRSEIDDLYSEYYAFIPATEVVRGDGDSFQIALGKYNAKEFEVALDELSSVESTRAHFYRGICRMELGNFERAILEFDEYLSKREEEMLPAEYYKALCLIKQNEIKKAKQALRNVPQSESYYYEKAQNLLKRI